MIKTGLNLNIFAKHPTISGMANGADKQAILILTDRISKAVIKSYHRIKEAAAETGDVFLLYHVKNNTEPAAVEGVKIETFTNEILTSLNYKPVRSTLVPGSNHFPVLDFFLKNPNYRYYWCIEDDVVFTGDWNDFFSNISSNVNYDFITSHVRKYSDFTNWSWWRTLKGPEGNLAKQESWCSFNPIYRISNEALQHLDLCLKGGYSGHHEGLMPTLLYMGGFKIADLGSKDNHITPSLSYCTLTTMRWKPVFFVPGSQKNKLYHPVKSKVTFKQVMMFIKRHLYNETEYFQ